jgi:tetratricopeptide (TPR) repeat protein
MRAYVFTDAALARHAGRFVWLEMDTEKKENAAFRTRFPVVALPTFFVVDPATEKVALRWVGGATVPQLEGILEDGRLAVAHGVPSTAPPAAGGKPAASGDAPATAQSSGKSGGKSTAKSAKAADAALARADALYGEGKDADAAQAYQEALAAAPGDWPRYGRTVESLLFALERSEQHEPAAALARDAFPRLAKTPSAANVAASGLESALGIAAENPQRAALVTALEADTRAVVDDAALPMAADDRSGAYIALLDARKAADDSAGAQAVAVQWSAFLDREAESAPNPEARAVFDSHRLSAYLELGQPERAVPMLQASERDLPDDYNPRARLAIAYKAMHRWDDAIAASDRALEKAYGPRRLGILQTRSDIFKERGDVEMARRTLEDALREAEALPEGQRSDRTIASIRKKLDTLPKS